MKPIFNPYLPSYEYIPDGEPHIFNNRLYIYGTTTASTAQPTVKMTMCAGLRLLIIYQTGGSKEKFITVGNILTKRKECCFLHQMLCRVLIKDIIFTILLPTHHECL